MCPHCQREGLQCEVREKGGGRIVCACGRHAWPNSAVYLEDCRRTSLTTTRRVHDWTQAY